MKDIPLIVRTAEIRDPIPSRHTNPMVEVALRERTLDTREAYLVSAERWQSRSLSRHKNRCSQDRARYVGRPRNSTFAVMGLRERV